jgi:hypothetical protein
VSKAEPDNPGVLQFASVSARCSVFCGHCCPFGFSPKISTPVENTVEKQMKRSGYSRKCQRFLHFRPGEAQATSIFRASGSKRTHFAPA